MSALTVLVVDDDPSLRLLCRVNLELDGHRVLEAASLDGARAQLGDAAVDVILLDMRLGNEQGVELLDDLPDARPRVVLFTGTVEIEEPLRRRVDAVLAKPFELEELAAVVVPT